MVKVTPDEFTEKWSERLKGATEVIRRQVDKVTVAPSAAAVAKKDKMKANLIKAIETGKWENQLKKYSLEAWKNDMKTIAIERLPSGVEKAKTDVKDFASQLLPYIEGVQRKIATMPDITLEDSIARMTTLVREMAKFQRK